jgi:hypothetical protein
MGLTKLSIGTLTTFLFSQLSYPYTGSPIKQLGLEAKLYNYQSSIVAQNNHCDSLKPTFQTTKLPSHQLLHPPPVTTFMDSLYGYLSCY